MDADQRELLLIAYALALEEEEQGDSWMLSDIELYPHSEKGIVALLTLHALSDEELMSRAKHRMDYDPAHDYDEYIDHNLECAEALCQVIQKIEGGK